jgi:hypothetical protein
MANPTMLKTINPVTWKRPTHNRGSRSRGTGSNGWRSRASTGARIPILPAIRSETKTIGSA